MDREGPSILCVAHKFQGKGERADNKETALVARSLVSMQKRTGVNKTFNCHPFYPDDPGFRDVCGLLKFVHKFSLLHANMHSCSRISVQHAAQKLSADFGE